MAVHGFSWQFGFIVGPAVGALVMSASPLAVWLGAAGVCLAGGAIALGLERRLPSDARVTPSARS